MRYLKIRKMEKPFYFTYEKVREVMKEYLPDIDDFKSFIDNNLCEEHCHKTRCSGCAFHTESGLDQACSFMMPTIVYDPVYKDHLRGDEAEGLVKGLNKTREICSEYANCNCSSCWLRGGPSTMYLCGGKERKL